MYCEPAIRCAHIHACNYVIFSRSFFISTILLLISELAVPGVIQNASVIQVPCANSTACVVIASWYPPSNIRSASVTHYIGRVTLGGEEVFNTTVNAGSNETALSAYYVVPNCTNNVLQNVGWSGAAVNQCGEGPRQNSIILPNSPNNISEDRCPTSPSASFAFKREFWIHTQD